MSERKGSDAISPDSSWLSGGPFSPDPADPPSATDGPVSDSGGYS